MDVVQVSRDQGSGRFQEALLGWLDLPVSIIPSSGPCGCCTTRLNKGEKTLNPPTPSYLCVICFVCHNLHVKGAWMDTDTAARSSVQGNTNANTNTQTRESRYRRRQHNPLAKLSHQAHQGTCHPLTRPSVFRDSTHPSHPHSVRKVPSDHTTSNQYGNTT
ncbi:hypothetical protein BD289DRAFT_169914 [Coniella lustricola]|uniref:Uncharacterized protein n=1 Tax=Coniella lustricola TaxID=2025994 RepID=A0A2T2ZTV7_9PEZI|nr:hypothetical protein BD289DRAFT_169914 [Coniella lustricola]